MLKDLKVLNGNLELKFNEYTYEYTVTVDNNIDSLELEYKLEDNCFINISNNILNDIENIVYIEVYNEENIDTYTLYVYKEKSDYTTGIDNYKKSLEIVNAREIEIYKLQLLGVGIFLSIIIVFSIIFHHRRVK